ncbi:penicillin amidase [Streptomyces fulvorobeus]|uniref:Lysine N-acyltransferase MbtK n=1 Tax=Streptomyces fulvorobeus TaxID=284028 RepID=A0A7Y9HBD3_9ACTN|nr:GNAT family N-acetyltransferase [Streptomyces fulvorobeus]NYE41402.1 penicillin amidase [Streptomyces fulvorobeus]
MDGSTAAETGFEVFRDDWGIPHLRADSALALARAQGHNAATDRAWQVETERHRLQGTTAAFLGEEALAWDRFARQARLEDTARRCFDRLSRLDPETADWVRAYVDGINAGLDEGAARAPEFAAAGVAPGRWRPWTPLGVWLATHILFAGFPTKLWREEVARRLGEDRITLFALDGPGTSGSNGWLLDGTRTVTGAPVVAGDPHRFIEDPGVYQQIRLACPEFDVLGLAVPGVPGIAHFGHTGGVAWAITNAMADYQDLYRERLRRTRDGGVEALGPDGWETATAHTETITVSGGAPVTVEIVETARGPVIIGGPEAGEETGAAAEAPDGGAGAFCVSLRYPPRVTGELGFEALPALLRARTVADLDTALDGWAEPVNVVLAADTTGATLHRVAGHVPLRARANQLRVVPADDPAYAWRGRHSPMPRTGSGADATGTAVMANERGIAAPFGVEFAPAHRADRIRELLGGQARWAPADMAAIHTDTRLDSARPLLGLLAETDGLGPRATELRGGLLRWDRHMDADSTDATLYSALRAEVVHRLAAHPALAPVTGAADPVRSTAHPELFRPWLAAVPRVGYALETLLGPALLPYEDRLAAVAGAVEAVAARYGDGNPPPPWGEVHRLAPWQAWPGTDPDPAASRPGLAGDHDCVLSTSSVPGVTDHSARGPAARYVWDLARREDSLWVIPFGASGIPGDAHHRDQLPLWTRGELAPVVTDWNLLHRDRPEERAEVTAAARAAVPAQRETVYEQEVEGLGTVRLVAIDPAADLDLIHSWVSEERARFWGMSDSTREEVLEAYTFLDSLTTHHGYLALRGGVPVAIFQTYDPAEDPLGECYEVRPGDFGVHLFVGPGDSTEPGYTGRLLSVLVSHAFSDPAHRRIVVEPDARNERAVARLVRAGFELGPEIEKPEKRARLAFLARPAAV